MLRKVLMATLLLSLQMLARLHRSVNIFALLFQEYGMPQTSFIKRFETIRWAILIWYWLEGLLDVVSGT